MTKQRAAIEYLIMRCCDADPDCGIQLQGSVAHRCERPDSDIDLTVVIGRREPRAYNELITKENQYGMTLIHVDDVNVNVDINWWYADDVVNMVNKNGASGWWTFYRGISIHDPKGLVQSCQQMISEWFGRNPSVADAWKRQQAQVEKHKENPEHVLEFPTQAEFCEHLRK